MLKVLWRPVGLKWKDIFILIRDIKDETPINFGFPASFYNLKTPQFHFKRS